MSSQSEAVYLHAAGAAGSSRMVCPWCGGGSTREASLSVLSDGYGKVSYRCWRAGCGVHGGDQLLAAPRKPARPFTYGTRVLTTRESSELRHKYKLLSTAGILFSDDLDRYVFIVRDVAGNRRGVIARAFDGRAPKTLTFKESADEPFLHWAKPQGYEPGLVIIVEDVLSAMRLAQQGATGVALLGCHMTYDAALEIAQNTAGQQAVLALDRDAFAKSLDLWKRHHALFNPPLRVQRLARDVKDDEPDNVKNWILEHDTRTTTTARNAR